MDAILSALTTRYPDIEWRREYDGYLGQPRIKRVPTISIWVIQRPEWWEVSAMQGFSSPCAKVTDPSDPLAAVEKLEAEPAFRTVLLRNTQNSEKTVKDNIVPVRIDIFLDRLAGEDSANEVANLAYAFFVKLFEAGGEHNRRPDGGRVMVGNGHHAAQHMAALVVEEWKRRTEPLKAPNGK